MDWVGLFFADRAWSLGTRLVGKRGKDERTMWEHIKWICSPWRK